MPLATLDGSLLAFAVWGLALAALLPALPTRLLPEPLPAPLSLARFLAVAASIALSIVGGLALAGVVPPPVLWWPGFPGEPFRIGADALAAPFLAITGVLAATAFATADYARGGRAATSGNRARFSLHAGFALALAGALAAEHALLFLFAWEGMTLLSAALVAHDTKSARGRSAAWTYLVLSQLGTAMVAFGVMGIVARAGSFDLTTLGQTMSLMTPAETAGPVWLLTIGFAVKLGLVPLHVWLPMAHPEAPGPVSALLSGAMVKAGLYGLLRFAWQLPGAPPAGWGETLAIAGTITALVGALYAAIEHDAKRLLACSTVKHAGVIALALGLAAAFTRSGDTRLAGVALAACLYHAVGHGLAKGLAFLATGEAVHAAGSRDLETLGGLAKRMPRVSAPLLVALLALCGLPLLSCFASEWLLFQSLILGYSAGEGALRLLVPFVGAGLALATALAAAALVKLYGIGFLGRPRSAAAAAAHDVPRVTGGWFMALAALGAAWGVLSPWALAALAAPVSALVGGGFDARALAGAGGLTLAIPPEALASISPLSVLVLIALFIGIAFAWGTARGLRHAVRIAPSWSCGAPLTPRMQYSALGFTKPLRLIFQPVLRIERELEIVEEGSPYFGGAMRFHSNVPALA
jgi:formate hydrogenlyase subunit 3/multisubunit Na+/H+ antiporter MnhD subunit